MLNSYKFFVNKVITFSSNRLKGMLSFFNFITLSVCIISMAEGQPAQTAKPRRTRQLLVTGWYYITEQPNNFKRQADKTNQFYYIDPNPVVTVKHFKQLDLSEAKWMNRTYPSLIIRFDEQGTKAWGAATARSVHNKMAFIIDNKLIITPTINQPSKTGDVSVVGDNFPIETLKTIKTELEGEIK
jgi:preprotein translocase subunit SecD